MTTNWQCDIETIEKRNSYILDNEMFTDCSFIVGIGGKTKTFKCHRSELAKSSPVFEAMFYGDLAKNEQFNIRVPDILPAAFKAMLQYIYCGKLSLTEVGVACGTLYAAKKYLLPHIFIEQIQAFIWAFMYPKDVWRVLIFADQNDEKILKNTAWKLIQEDTCYLLQQEDMLSLSESNMIHLLQQNQLNCSEFTLYRACVRWARHHTSGTKTVRETAEPLIRHIRFLSMTTEQLSRCLKYDKLLTNEESTNIFMSICLPVEEMNVPRTISLNRNVRSVLLYEDKEMDVIACKLPIKEPRRNTFSVLSTAKIEVNCELKCLGVIIPSQIKPEKCISDTYFEDLTAILYNSTGVVLSQTNLWRQIKYNTNIHLVFEDKCLIKATKNTYKATKLKVKIIFHTSGKYPYRRELDGLNDVRTGNFGRYKDINLWRNEGYRYISWFASEYDITEENQRSDRSSSVFSDATRPAADSSDDDDDAPNPFFVQLLGSPDRDSPEMPDSPDSPDPDSPELPDSPDSPDPDSPELSDSPASPISDSPASPISDSPDSPDVDDYPNMLSDDD